MTAVRESVLLYLEHLDVVDAFDACCTLVPRSSIGDLSAYARGDGRGVRAVITAGGAPMEEAVWDFPDLGLIACLGAGYDGIDVERARRRGVRVTVGRGVNDEDVADMALGLLLATVRQIPLADRMVRDGAWKGGLLLPMVPSLSRMRCGIVGLGAIGNAIGRRLAGFGSAISWWGPRDKPDAPWPRASSLQHLARDCDALIVAAPATAETQGIIDARILEALGSRGYLVNISRGSLVDEQALLMALEMGGIAGAGLDVFVDEPHDGTRWRHIDSLVMTPHVGAWAERAMAEAKYRCAENIAAFLHGEPLPSAIV
ncbi:NAD(P)-dependent oxidoreductase [Sphingobium sp.]|uniref:NAD(P)-dependent oxidoreductase n=1 Tax=Sphingobium sp. TaxID=1912891 RepID=UPI002C82A4D6|nr:NAD(P)-dependent oxidoreductase [Sphingobium sp.]HUD92802.1 NAD(P)-dependent oxidoreductase [Sphingobium sp.]